MTDANLLEALRRALDPRPEILEAYLFGSAATGATHAQSDIDVAVYLDQARVTASPWGEDSDVTADLMKALHRNDVDVVILNHAPPMLYERVLRNGVRGFARDLMATTVREGRALSRYFDWLPVQRRIDALLSR